MTTSFGDAFGNANAYEGYVGRWSRLVGREFVTWLEVPAEHAWLDVGAGTGVLTHVIVEQASPLRVVGVDTSAEYIDFARQHISDPRVEFHVADAGALGFEAQFDAAVAGLVLNFVPSAESAVIGMRQAVKAGGTVAAYVWDYSGDMQMMRHFWDAANAVDPSAAALDAGGRFAIAKPENLRALFESLQFDGVDVIPIDVPTRFTSFDDYWLPFLGAQGSVAKYLRGLSDTTRAAVRDQLQSQLPIAGDGSIALIARAWAVKGTKRP